MADSRAGGRTAVSESVSGDDRQLAAVDVEEGNPMTLRSFPDGFLWGVATAGHQNEGDNVNSDTWFLEQRDAVGVPEPSGKACNGWELWARTSTSSPASASTPTASRSSGRASSRARASSPTTRSTHYEAIVDRCLERGLAPVVTFNHFTAPHWFADARRLARPGGARRCSRATAAA